jgi:signal transduction histidine kinase
MIIYRQVIVIITFRAIMKWVIMMKNKSFPFDYFFDTLFEQCIILAANMPTTYLTLLISLIVAIFNIATNLPIYLALVLGILLKFIFTLSMKDKTFKEELSTIAIDIIAGALIVFLFSITVQWIILFMTLLFLLYQSFAMAKSYQRLTIGKDTLSEELKQRHQKQMKKTGKRRK